MPTDEDDVKIQLAVIYEDIQFVRVTIPLFDMELISQRLIELNGEERLAAQPVLVYSKRSLYAAFFIAHLV